MKSKLSQKVAIAGGLALVSPLFMAQNCNNPNCQTGVVINEIMYNPAASDDANGEFVELFNANEDGCEPIDITGWTLGDRQEPTNTNLVSGNTLLESGDTYLAVRSGTSLNNGGIIRVDTTFTFRLANPGFADRTNGEDSIVLTDAAGVLVDQVDYVAPYAAGSAPWPYCVHPSTPDANAAGVSIQRFSPDGASNDGANWLCSTTPYGDGDLGTPNAN